MQLNCILLFKLYQLSARNHSDGGIAAFHYVTERESDAESTDLFTIWPRCIRDVHFGLGQPGKAQNRRLHALLQSMKVLKLV